MSEKPPTPSPSPRTHPKSRKCVCGADLEYISKSRWRCFNVACRVPGITAPPPGARLEPKPLESALPCNLTGLTDDELIGLVLNVPDGPTDVEVRQIIEHVRSEERLRMGQEKCVASTTLRYDDHPTYTCALDAKHQGDHCSGDGTCQWTDGDTMFDATERDFRDLRRDDTSPDAEKLRAIASYVRMWADGDDAWHSIAHIRTLLPGEPMMVIQDVAPVQTYVTAGPAQPTEHPSSSEDAQALVSATVAANMPKATTKRELRPSDGTVRDSAERLLARLFRQGRIENHGHRMSHQAGKESGCDECRDINRLIAALAYTPELATANLIPPLNEQTMTKAWDDAMRLIRERGEDPDELIGLAAKNVEAHRMADAPGTVPIATYNGLQRALEEANEMVCRFHMPYGWPDFQTRWGLRTATEVLATPQGKDGT